MEAMTLLGWGLDIVLAAGLLWLAWQMLSSPDLFKAIVLFVAYGLLMALAWVRLDAPDVALAEAAIGAGLTGALLLAALPRLRSPQPANEETMPQMRRGRRIGPSAWVAALILVPVAIGLGYVVSTLPPQAPNLRAAVGANLAASGVSNPVTAVLLNFRGYDTLLEMVVLLLALLGVWSLEPGPVPTEDPPGRVLDTLSRSLPPVLILVAAYLLWAGAHAPGGAFQAGSVLGAVGVLLLLAGWRLPVRFAGWPLRIALVAGAGSFVTVALSTRFTEGRLLEYPRDLAGDLILILETAATLSIGVTLAALFLGRRPPDQGNGK
jgi:multisubunit Na+/H+ antiporter MnhB subunit